MDGYKKCFLFFVDALCRIKLLKISQAVKLH